MEKHERSRNDNIAWQAVGAIVMAEFELGTGIPLHDLKRHINNTLYECATGKRIDSQPLETESESPENS